MLTINNGEGFKETISLLNNFVHPYNSSNNIKLNYGGEYKIGITINKAYSNEEITKINEVVDKVIKEKITNNMPTREKIKTNFKLWHTWILLPIFTIVMDLMN